MRLFFRLLFALAAAWMAAGCSDRTGDAGPAGNSNEAGTARDAADSTPWQAGQALAAAVDVEWRLLSLGDNVLLPGDVEVTIRFEGDGFSGQGPCNRYFGARNTNPNLPSLFGPVGATRMACPDTQMRYEAQYFEALGGVRAARIDGERLVLDWQTEDEQGELVFVRVLAPPEGV